MAKKEREIKRLTAETKKEWLFIRDSIGGIGGSDAGAVCEVNPYRSREQCMNEMLGLTERPDLSENEKVQTGILIEPLLRNMYAVTNGKYTVECHPYDIIYRSDIPWRFATLDGELTDESGRKGVWEAKYTKVYNPKQLMKWDGSIPDYYYAQIVHQLLATEYEYAVLTAFIHKWDGDILIKNYEFNASELTEDMAWVDAMEREFMEQLKEKRNETEESE